MYFSRNSRFSFKREIFMKRNFSYHTYTYTLCMIFVHSRKIHVAKIFTRQNANNSCARKIHALQYAFFCNDIIWPIRLSVCRHFGLSNIFFVPPTNKMYIDLHGSKINKKTMDQRLYHLIIQGLQCQLLVSKLLFNTHTHTQKEKFFLSNCVF